MKCLNGRRPGGMRRLKAVEASKGDAERNTKNSYRSHSFTTRLLKCQYRAATTTVCSESSRAFPES